MQPALPPALGGVAAEAEPLLSRYVPALLEPYTYVCRAAGKEIRPQLIDAFNEWLHVEPDKVSMVKDVVQKLHNASLLIDDIEDSSQLRRGMPAAHKVYGEAHTINAANFVYFVALEDCLSMGKLELAQVFVSELLRLHRGQGCDIFWRDNHICPTEEEYISMVLDKTGGLFRLAVALMRAFSSTEVPLGGLVDSLAVFFQVLDDFLNLQSEKYHENKSFCEDLTEGKFSFPVIHCVRSSPNDRRMLSILKQRTADVNIKRYALQVLAETESLRYTQQRLREMLADVEREIARCGGNRKLLAIVHMLADSAGLRDSAPPSAS